VFDIASTIVSAPAVGQSAVYFGAFDNNLYALTNGSLAWNFTTGGAVVSSPLICNDGSVVFGSEDGFLYCVWGSSPPAGTDAPWPTFHQNAQRTGLQPGTNAPFNGCDAPFIYDGTNDGMGDFMFQIIGVTNSTWNVYWSDDLSNWTQFSGTVTLEPASGVTNSSGFGSFTDTNAAILRSELCWDSSFGNGYSGVRSLHRSTECADHYSAIRNGLLHHPAARRTDGCVFRPFWSWSDVAPRRD
jgi:hypothetical protein